MSVQSYYLLVNGSRYELPTRGQNANETLEFERNIRNRPVPGGERAFVVGDGVWKPGRIGISFMVLGSGSNPRYDALTTMDTIQANAEAATSLIRELETEGLETEGGDPLTTESGEPLMATTGTARALLGVKAFRVTEVEAQPDKYRVTVRWLAKFGLATDNVIEDRSNYSASAGVTI